MSKEKKCEVTLFALIRPNMRKMGLTADNGIGCSQSEPSTNLAAQAE